LTRDLKSGASRGYGFVRFSSANEANKACRIMDGELLQVFFICLCDHTTSYTQGKRIGVIPSGENKTLFIGNLRKDWTKAKFDHMIKDRVSDIILSFWSLIVTSA
jgi:RNA recognition motif-containing protein